MIIKKIYRLLSKILVIILSTSLILAEPMAMVSSAQTLYSPAGQLTIATPGTMIGLSTPTQSPILKGIKVFPDEPFRFEFLLDPGNGSVSTAGVEDEANRLIRYFLASLTIPEDEMWVNLSPYENDRIVPASFGVTEMGRDLLAEDYLLKQITASLMYPESEIGAAFWDKIREEARTRFGTDDIPVETFNKVWIVPDDALVYESESTSTAYVLESRLKVMLEKDYLAEFQNQQAADDPTDALSAQIIRDIIIPALEEEVNYGQHFVKLRQIYHSLILAGWYKRKIQSGILNQVYVNQKKTTGVDIEDPEEKQKIYAQYIEAFNTGVYNYVKEEYDPLNQQIVPRKYFSGGVEFKRTNLNKAVTYTNRLSSMVAASVLAINVFLSPAVKVDAHESHSMEQTEEQAKDTEGSENYLDSFSEERRRNVVERVERVFPFFEGHTEEIDRFILKRAYQVNDSITTQWLGWLEEIERDYPFLLDFEGNMEGNHLEANKQFIRSLPDVKNNEDWENTKTMYYYHMAMLNIYANMYGMDPDLYRAEMTRAMADPKIKDFGIIDVNHEYEYDMRVFRFDQKIFPWLAGHEIAHNITRLGYNYDSVGGAVMSEFVADMLGGGIVKEVYGDGGELKQMRAMQYTTLMERRSMKAAERQLTYANPWLRAMWSKSQYQRRDFHYFARVMSVMFYRELGPAFDENQFAQAIMALEKRAKIDPTIGASLDNQKVEEIVISDLTKIFSVLWEELTGKQIEFDQKIVQMVDESEELRVHSDVSLDEVMADMRGESGVILILPVFPDQWDSEEDNAVLNELLKDVDPSALMESLRAFSTQSRYPRVLAQSVRTAFLAGSIFAASPLVAEESLAMQPPEVIEARLREALEPVMEERRQQEQRAAEERAEKERKEQEERKREKQEALKNSIENIVEVFPFYRGHEDEIEYSMIEQVDSLKSDFGLDWINDIASQFPFLIDVEGNLTGQRLEENKTFIQNLPKLSSDISKENQKTLRYYHMAIVNMYANVFGMDAALYRQAMAKAMSFPEIADVEGMSANNFYRYSKPIFKSDSDLMVGFIAHEVAHNLSDMAYPRSNSYEDAIVVEFVADVLGLAIVEQIYGDSKEYDKFKNWQTMMVRVADPFNLDLRIKSLFSPWLSAYFNVPRVERKGHHYFSRALGVIVRRAVGDDFDALRFARAIYTIEERMQPDAENRLELKGEKFGDIEVSDVTEVFSALWTEYSGVEVEFGKKYIEASNTKREVRVSSGKTLQQALANMEGEEGGIIILPVFPDQWDSEEDNAVLNALLNDVDVSVMFEGMPALNPERVQGADNVGGIDFNPSALDLQIQNDGRAIEINMDNIDIDMYRDAEGFTPVIINIQPVMNLPLFLGANQEQTQADTISAL